MGVWVLAHSCTDRGAADGSNETDAPVAPPEHPIARAGDLWLLGRHRLLCGSALEPAAWNRLLDGRSARMVFSDPPYNVKVEGHVSGWGKARHKEFAQASAR